MEEISVALSERSKDHPGPNGFSFGFIRARCDFLKDDFYAVLSKFHQRRRLNMEIKATFITLIANVPSPL